MNFKFQLQATLGCIFFQPIVAIEATINCNVRMQFQVAIIATNGDKRVALVDFEFIEKFKQLKNNKDLEDENVREAKVCQENKDLTVFQMKRIFQKTRTKKYVDVDDGEFIWSSGDRNSFMEVRNICCTIK